MGGWVSAPPPPPWGGVGHLSVCGYAKILGGWVPELTPPPPLGWLSKTLVLPTVERIRLLLYWPHTSALVAYNGGTSIGHGLVRTLFLEPDFESSANDTL